jgi:hypothetical protein
LTGLSPATDSALMIYSNPSKELNHSTQEATVSLCASQSQIHPWQKLTSASLSPGCAYSSHWWYLFLIKEGCCF